MNGSAPALPFHFRATLAQLNFQRQQRIAAVAAFRHLDAHEAIMRKRRPHPQFVPGIEHRRRQRFAFRHQAPRRLAHGRGRAFQLQFRVVVLPAGQPGEGLGETCRARFHAAQQPRDLVEGVHPDQPRRGAGEMAALLRAEHR